MYKIKRIHGMLLVFFQTRTKMANEKHSSEILVNLFAVCSTKLEPNSLFPLSLPRSYARRGTVFLPDCMHSFAERMLETT